MPAKTDALSPAAKKTADAIEIQLQAIEANALTAEDAKIEADIRKQLKAQRSAFEAALKLPAAKVEAALRTLLKKAEAVDAATSKQSMKSQDAKLRRDKQARVSAAMMQWMLALGKIDDPVLRKPLVDEQAQWRKRLDAIEKSADDWAAFKELEGMDRALPPMLAKAVEAQGVSQWVRATYQSAVARAEAALKAVPDSKCRAALGAELAAVEQMRRKQLGAGKVAEAKQESIRRLMAVVKTSARIRASSASIDRQFEHLDGLVRKHGLGMKVGETLRSLRMHKQGGWPRSTSVDDMEREVIAFEQGVSRLTALVAREAAAAEKTAKA